jgi:hypothetical protein
MAFSEAGQQGQDVFAGALCAANARQLKVIFFYDPLYNNHII